MIVIKINIRKNLHNALTLKEINWIPCTAFCATPLSKEIEKMNISFPSGYNNPTEMAKIAEISYKKVGLEGITLPSNLCFEAEAMGCSVEIKSENDAKITNSPFEEIIDVEMPEGFIDHERFQVIEKTIEILHEKYDSKEIPIIGSMIGPFTLLSQILTSNVESLLKYIGSNIVDVEDALYYINTGLLEEIDFYNELGVDVMVIYEPNATPSLLEPDMFKQILKPFFEELSNNTKIPSVLHICGDTTSTLENMMSCGFDAINIDSEVNITEAKQLQAELNSPTRICGNVSTEETLFRKRPKEIKQESYEILSKGVDILSPSCMISPNTPIKNIKAMIEARNEFCELNL